MNASFSGESGDESGPERDGTHSRGGGADSDAGTPVLGVTPVAVATEAMSGGGPTAAMMSGLGGGLGTEEDFHDMNLKNTTGIDDDGVPPYCMRKSERLERLQRYMTYPSSYRHNSPKEDLCLEFVEHFRGQYVQLFGSRPPLMLSPENECGVKKFICTFVRPTDLSYGELYDYDTCARYIANYVRYEPLEDAEKLPRVVVSPTTTLAWQTGDCFDMSLLLLSLLLGNGYDAYCIIGYATREIVMNDQGARKCPVAIPEEPDPEKITKAEKALASKYTLRKRPELQSAFQRELEERKRREREEANKQDEAEEVDGGQDPSQDPLYFSRVHCWIMIQSGKRDVSANLFIEPSTGDITPVDQAHKYIGIESVFNNANYWVNMQENKSVPELSYDLKDAKSWEYIFLSDSLIDEGDLQAKERRKVENLTSDNGDSGDQILDLPSSWVAKIELSRQQYENRYAGLQKAIQYRDATLELFAAYSEPDMKVKRIRLIEYGEEIEVHTFFSFRTDKLRRRSVYHATNERNQVVHEWFDEGRRREQTMEALREYIAEEGRQCEMRFYWKARLDGLSKRVEVFFPPEGEGEGADGSPPVATGHHSRGGGLFASSAHPPSTTPPQKVMEFFEGREDRLVYRSITYNPPDTGVTITITTPSVASSKAAEDRPNPRKMCEKFNRNPDLPPDQDVGKRTYYSPGSQEGQIRLIYHYAEGKITRPSRIYSKGNPVMIEHVDPFAKYPKPQVLSEEMRALFLKEKECLANCRESEKEARDILLQREKEERDVGSVTTVYDTLRNKPKEDEQAEIKRKQEELLRSQKKKDYLGPYIEQVAKQRPFRGPSAAPRADVKLTKEEAMRVKELCLKDLKDRLIQRAHIMQNRLDEEKERLARKQSNFQKNQEQMDNTKEHEDYILFCENAMWRIHILEKRLERHQEQSLQKYAALDQRLRRDPRLAIIS